MTMTIITRAEPATGTSDGPTRPRPHSGVSGRIDDLFAQRDRAPSLAARQAIEAEVVGLLLEYADSVTARYLGRGIEQDDLIQVGRLGLYQAVRRFQPDKGTPFLAFAAPTISGEVKRYFRDHGWAVRPPRRLQELNARVGPAIHDLEQRLHRPPTPAELAHELGTTITELNEGRCAETGFTAQSLNGAPGDDGVSWEDILPAGEDEAGAADTRVALLKAVATLTARERQVVGLRFGQDLTQTQIAAQLGISQMQVSRILTRILTTLRRKVAQHLTTWAA